jgi:glycosyltransferase involved in cell wall biosynthesis
MKSFAPLTIAIPTYRRRASVVSLVDSIVPQLFDEDELLVVDDGSQDGTRDVLEKIPRIRTISNISNEGMVKTWNKCLACAKNDWICIIHDDDIVAPQALETIRKACALSSSPCLIGHNYDEQSCDLGFRCRVVEPGSWSAMHPLVIPSGATIHKDVLAAVGLFDEEFEYSTDIEFFSRVGSKFTTIVVENPRIITFKLHGQNYEYKTWGKPDFFSQLETIERRIAKYSNLTEDEASNYVSNKMNDYIRYMLRTSYKAQERGLARKIGSSVKNKPYLRRKNRILANVAAATNWVLDI